MLLWKCTHAALPEEFSSWTVLWNTSSWVKSHTLMKSIIIDVCRKPAVKRMQGQIEHVSRSATSEVVM
eukprot:1161484-Pelagomonas_calceolata.AAC.4